MSILLTRSAGGVSADLDRIGQMIVEPRLHLAHELAEAQHHADFIGLDAGRSRKSPTARSAASAISAMPRPPRLPGSRPRNLSWPRRRNSSRSGGFGPCDCGPEPHGPRGPEPHGRRRRIGCSTASNLSSDAGAAGRPRLRGVIGERTAPYNAQLCRARRTPLPPHLRAFVADEGERSFVLGGRLVLARAQFRARASDR